jgi:hypothetical protein
MDRQNATQSDRVDPGQLGAVEVCGLSPHGPTIIFNYVREISAESERHFACNSSPVIGAFGQIKIASHWSQWVPTSGLPTNRRERREAESVKPSRFRIR